MAVAHWYRRNEIGNVELLILFSECCLRDPRGTIGAWPMMAQGGPQGRSSNKSLVCALCFCLQHKTLGFCRRNLPRHKTMVVCRRRGEDVHTNPCATKTMVLRNTQG